VLASPGVFRNKTPLPFHRPARCPPKYPKITWTSDFEAASRGYPRGFLATRSNRGTFRLKGIREQCLNFTRVKPDIENRVSFSLPIVKSDAVRRSARTFRLARSHLRIAATANSIITSGMSPEYLNLPTLVRLRIRPAFMPRGKSRIRREYRRNFCYSSCSRSALSCLQGKRREVADRC